MLRAAFPVPGGVEGVEERAVASTSTASPCFGLIDKNIQNSTAVILKILLSKLHSRFASNNKEYFYIEDHNFVYIA